MRFSYYRVGVKSWGRYHHSSETLTKLALQGGVCMCAAATYISPVREKNPLQTAWTSRTLSLNVQPDPHHPEPERINKTYHLTYSQNMITGLRKTEFASKVCVCSSVCVHVPVRACARVCVCPAGMVYPIFYHQCSCQSAD